MQITLVPTFIWLGTGVAPFPDLASLESTTLPSICHYSRLLEVSSTDLSCSKKDQSVSMTKSFQEPMANIFNRIFGPESSLHPFLQLNLYNQAQAHYRSYLAFLSKLKGLHYDLHDDMTQSISFLLRLGKLVGGRGQAKPKFLPSSSLLWTVLCIWACLRTDRTAMLLI